MAEPKRIPIQSRWRTNSHNPPISNHPPTTPGAHTHRRPCPTCQLRHRRHRQHIGRAILRHPTDSEFNHLSTKIGVKPLLQPFPV